MIYDVYDIQTQLSNNNNRSSYRHLPFLNELLHAQTLTSVQPVSTTAKKLARIRSVRSCALVIPVTRSLDWSAEVRVH